MGGPGANVSRRECWEAERADGSALFPGSPLDFARTSRPFGFPVAQQSNDGARSLGRQEDSSGIAPQAGRNVVAGNVTGVHPHQLRFEGEAEQLRIARAARPRDRTSLQAAVDV